MKRSLALAIVGVVLALTVAGSLAQDKALTKVTFALTTKDISVGHAAHTSLPVVLGYWKDEGLDASVASVEGSTAGAQQLAAGNIHVVSVGPEVILIAREKGMKIKSFYVQARETIFRLVVPADSPIQKAADLRGKTIGVPSLASGSVPYTKTLVASAGLDPVVSAAIDDLILKLRDALGMTIVVVTHELSSAFKIADRIAVLDRGELLMVGTVAEVRSHGNERIQQLLNRRFEDEPVDPDEYLRRLTGETIPEAGEVA